MKQLSLSGTRNHLGMSLKNHIYFLIFLEEQLVYTSNSYLYGV